MLERIFPKQADNTFAGQRAALWLLGLLIFLKLAMSLNSIVNTESVAVGADGFRIDRYGADGARAVLMLFALTALGQLALALVSLTALIRYRSLLPLIYVVLVTEHVARRVIVQSYVVARGGTGSIGWYVNYGLLALLALGLLLSLVPAHGRRATHRAR